MERARSSRAPLPGSASLCGHLAVFVSNAPHLAQALRPREFPENLRCANTGDLAAKVA